MRQVILFSIGVLAFVMMAVPADAQSRSEREMAERIQRLEREVQDLERDYYGRAAGNSNNNAVLDSASSQATSSVRINQLENSIRALTGQVEELTFRLKQTQDQLNKLSADVDYSLAGETPPDSSGSLQNRSSMSSAQPSSASQNGSNSRSPQSLAPPSGYGNEQAAPAESTLGTVPEEDVSEVQARAQSGFESPNGAVQQNDNFGSSVNASRQAMVGNNPEEQYDYAMGQLRGGDYASAEQSFSRIVSQYPDAPLAGNAQYWLGESFYVRQMYDKAAVAFLKGYREHPAGAKAPDSLLKLAMTLNHLGEKSEACLTFDEFRRKFPNVGAAIADRAARERAAAGCK